MSQKLSCSYENCSGATRLISITVLNNRVSQGLVRLNGIGIKVSTGPLRLSATTGAPLLPVFAVRQQDGSYRVVIEEPLISDGQEEQSNNWAIELDKFGKMLKKQIDEDPVQLRYAYLS